MGKCWTLGYIVQDPMCTDRTPRMGSGLYIQGSDTFPWGSGLTIDALEYITFSRHVAAPEPPTWWGQALLLV